MKSKNAVFPPDKIWIKFNSNRPGVFKFVRAIFAHWIINQSIKVSLSMLFCLKVMANEDTLLQTHCCRHTCFPVCPRAQHLLRIQILCPGHKNVSDFVQKHFVSATNVSQFARARRYPVISPPGSFATNQLATKQKSPCHQAKSPRHQAKSSRHQTLE